MLQLTGKNFIGNELSGSGKDTLQAINPATGEKILPKFKEATDEEIDAAVNKAEEAFQVYRKKSGQEKAEFLQIIGDEIIALGDYLIKRCCQESGLPEGRITGERGRTVNQLRLFASLLREGSWVDARIDTGEPEREPLPKPDVRSMQIALGPVGIFGASNFPLAFSVAGGDTASALAAGCTIIVKAHPAHPGTCEMVATAIKTAVEKSNMPDGTFSMLHGASKKVGMAIVRHPLVKAVGFTGSFRGGKALFEAAAQRPEPIPVYAEMGSVNPVFVLPEAMKERKAAIASGFTASVTLGVGQFCTNPGIITYVESPDGTDFSREVANNLEKITMGAMLTPGIHKAYENGIKKLQSQPGVKISGRGLAEKGAQTGIPYFMEVDTGQFLTNDQLEEEVFGPSSLAVNAKSADDLLKIASAMKGQLTASLFATDKDLDEYKELVHLLERKVGRLIINGFPTGVEVCHSMIHGGPFPATTDSRTTSVGTAAIHRFARPVCYQNFPEKLLPDELKDGNPLGIWRFYNGVRGK